MNQQRGASKHEARERPSRKPAVPTASRALLWLGGAAGLLITAAGALGGSDPGREASHVLGVLVFGTTSVAAVLAAWLLPRRARIGRRLGVAAAGGGLFIGWLLTQSSRSGLGAVLIGVAVAGACAFVAWQLVQFGARGRDRTG